MTEVLKSESAGKDREVSALREEVSGLRRENAALSEAMAEGSRVVRASREALERSNARFFDLAGGEEGKGAVAREVRDSVAGLNRIEAAIRDKVAHVGRIAELMEEKKVAIQREVAAADADHDDLLALVARKDKEIRSLKLQLSTSRQKIRRHRTYSVAS